MTWGQTISLGLFILTWNILPSFTESPDLESSEASVFSTYPDFYRELPQSDVYCDDPGHIRYGHRQPEVGRMRTFPSGTKLHFVCRPGYTLEGLNKMVCNKEGVWEPPEKPLCQLVTCPELFIKHGQIRAGKRAPYSTGTAVQVVCDEGYRLRDKSFDMIECHLGGNWVRQNAQFTPEMPTCVDETCSSPPQLPNSQPRVDGYFGWDGGYKLNSVVTYHCNYDFQIENLQGSRLICRSGRWQPEHPNVPLSKCVQGGCSQPLPINHGNYVPQLPSIYPSGTAVTYSCYAGFQLSGQFTIFHCTANGEWTPPMRGDFLPTCQPVEKSSCQDSLCQVGCSAPQYIEHGRIKEINGTGNLVPKHYHENTRINYECDPGFRLRDCSASWIVCKDGHWLNPLPECVELNGCGAPPVVLESTVIRLDLGIAAEPSENYPLYTKIHYKCLPGFQLLGTPDLICSLNGCWLPNAPQCIFTSASYDADWHVHPPATPAEVPHPEYNWTDGHLVIVSVATAGSIIGALLLIQVLVLFQRKKCCAHRQHLRLHSHRRRSSSASLPSSPCHLPPNQDPDRLALIAFADGMQVVLPSYEEAIRQSGPPSFEAFAGVHRGRWGRGGLPSLPPTRRFRVSTATRDNSIDSANSGATARQSSTSHSASVADSIGSTDTVANSEVSTTVTLDTLSSNASNASQALSSRAICGSLASFDTCSVINTEGVPLLEVIETECGEGLGQQQQQQQQQAVGGKEPAGEHHHQGNKEDLTDGEPNGASSS